MAYTSERVQQKIEELERKLNSKEPLEEEEVKFQVSGHQLLRIKGKSEPTLIMTLEAVTEVSYHEKKDTSVTLYLIDSKGNKPSIQFSTLQKMGACRMVIVAYLEKRKKLSLFLEMSKANPLASAKDTWAKVEEMWASLQDRACTEML